MIKNFKRGQFRIVPYKNKYALIKLTYKLNDDLSFLPTWIYFKIYDSETNSFKKESFRINYDNGKFSNINMMDAIDSGMYINIIRAGGRQASRHIGPDGLILPKETTLDEAVMMLHIKNAELEEINNG